MLKPVCVPCQRFYRPKENGKNFVEGYPLSGDFEPAGTAAPEKWGAYKLWQGDLWACPDCGNEIIVGVGRTPIREKHAPDFAEAIEKLGATLQVNDC